jgi:addiction module RelE/StbE family toxin
VNKLNISPQAFSDLQNIEEYITKELGNPVAAQNTVSKIINAVRGLVDFPDIGAPLSSIVDLQTNYRFLVSGNYLIFYRHEDGRIFVIRILYGKRDYIRSLFGE